MAAARIRAAGDERQAMVGEANGVGLRDSRVEAERRPVILPRLVVVRKPMRKIVDLLLRFGATRGVEQATPLRS